MDEAQSTPRFRFEDFAFQPRAVSSWAGVDAKHENWPVVYAIYNNRYIYVGETTKAVARMRQHLADSRKKDLKQVRIILDETFNKSACLHLENELIGLFQGDGRFLVKNGNGGRVDSDYFDRDKYADRFAVVYDRLLADGLLTRSVPEIVNSELFKFSPFKTLNADQAAAVEGVIESLFEGRQEQNSSPIVLQGDPGTGKTIVAVYLVKLLTDIAAGNIDDEIDSDALFSDFFQREYLDAFKEIKIGVVIPQQALRKTLGNVFSKTPGLSRSMILSPFEVGKSPANFDVLIVDEVHRLGQRSNQPAASQNRDFKIINERLFGDDSPNHTQLDWIRAKSRHQVLLLDVAQSVKPGDLPLHLTNAVIESARHNNSLFRLHSQMRVRGGSDYIAHIDAILKGQATGKRDFGDYEFRLFDDVSKMKAEIVRQNDSVGLSRLIAGYAWKWVSRLRGKSHVPDIVIDGVEMFWNRTQKDWVNTPNSINEVGSIHTIQGYDLNYAGVIIGKDLYLDPISKTIEFSRENYFDKKGRENNRKRGIIYSYAEIAEFVKNIYRVLLTRGIRGTYIYVCDPALREYFRKFVP